ncbi:MAG: hypothetical protein K940chlam3_00274 [Chlamydiae bacterium]|nr:hypothetical protein [Chlamydiota bacterium]
MQLRTLCTTLLMLLTFSLFAQVPPPVVEPRAYDFLRGENLKICVPSCPVSSDALEIQNIGNHQRFQTWTAEEHEETYDFLQRIRSCWNRCDYTRSYMVYGQTSPNLRSEKFHWQVIPYPEDGWSRLKQLQVIWNVSFGASFLSEKERIAQATQLRQYTQYLPENYQRVQAKGPSDDPFCNPGVTGNQCVYEGDEMLVLYDHAPVRIVEENPHFLITPKKHKETFGELTASEYKEAMALAEKVTDYFQESYPQSTLHFFHKTGKAAGQTVPHWHMHVIVVKEDAYLPSFEFPCVKSPTSCTRLDSPFRHIKMKFGQFCQSCKNFVFLMLPHRKLPPKVLEQRVEFYKEEFNDTFEF